MIVKIGFTCWIYGLGLAVLDVNYCGLGSGASSRRREFLTIHCRLELEILTNV